MKTKTSLAVAAIGATMAVLPALAADASSRLGQLEADTVQLAERAGAGDILLAQAAPQHSVAADMEVRLQRLERVIQELTGRVEENAYRVGQIEDRLERMSGDYEFRFQALEKSGAAAPPAPGKPTPAPSAPTAGKLPDRPAEKTPDKPPAAATANTPAMSGDPQADYDRAYSLLAREEWEKAEKAFAGFVQRYPKHALAGNSQYWLGETFYVRRQYQEAMVAFAEGFRSYPTSTKAPDNLLKLGMSLTQLGKKKEACTAFGQLVERFPKASPTTLKRADAESRKLACGK